MLCIVSGMWFNGLYKLTISLQTFGLVLYNLSNRKVELRVTRMMFLGKPTRFMSFKLEWL